jgi:hypothetical protein
MPHKKEASKPAMGCSAFKRGKGHDRKDYEQRQHEKRGVHVVSDPSLQITVLRENALSVQLCRHSRGP